MDKVEHNIRKIKNIDLWQYGKFSISSCIQVVFRDIADDYQPSSQLAGL